MPVTEPATKHKVINIDRTVVIPIRRTFSPLPFPSFKHVIHRNGSTGVLPDIIPWPSYFPLLALIRTSSNGLYSPSNLLSGHFLLRAILNIIRVGVGHFKCTDYSSSFTFTEILMQITVSGLKKRKKKASEQELPCVYVGRRGRVPYGVKVR